MIRFFTYGTFRAGECRHHVLKSFGVIFVQAINTAPEYTLVNVGAFPGMLESGNDSVVGELYDVPEEAIPTFDIIEGHPTFFCRKNVKLADGTSAVSYVFLCPLDRYGKIKTGDWCKQL